MSTFCVVVPLDGIRPVPWSRAYRNDPRSGRVLSAEARAFKRHVGEWVALAWNQLPPMGRDRLRNADDLVLTVEYALLPPLPDLDNVHKLPQDSLMETIGQNDKHIAELHLWRREVRRDPELRISLSALPSEEETT